MQKLLEWYNEELGHSALRYGTPNERHEAKVEAPPQARGGLYKSARAANSSRLIGGTRELEACGWGLFKSRAA